MTNLREIARDSRGNALYVEDTEQGRVYWSDEIGGGVVVWHTALVSEELLRLALEAEARAMAADRDDGARQFLLEQLDRSGLLNRQQRED